MSNDVPVNNPGPYDMTCPFCNVALVGGPAWYGCPECKTFSRHIIPWPLEYSVAIPLGQVDDHALAVLGIDDAPQEEPAS